MNAPSLSHCEAAYHQNTNSVPVSPPNAAKLRSALICKVA